MTTRKERLPSFTEKDYPPGKMRQMVASIERRLDSMQEEIDSGGSGTGTSTSNHEMAFFLGR